jgi:hypothetical protein
LSHGTGTNELRVQVTTQSKTTSTRAKKSPTEVNHTLWFFGKMLQKLVITTFTVTASQLSIMQKLTDMSMFEPENTIKTVTLFAKT